MSCVQVASTWGYVREGYTAMNQRQVPYLGSLFDFPYDNVRTYSYVKEHRVRTNEYVKNKRTIIWRWMETGGPGGEHVQRQIRSDSSKTNLTIVDLGELCLERSAKRAG